MVFLRAKMKVNGCKNEGERRVRGLPQGVRKTTLDGGPWGVQGASRGVFYNILHFTQGKSTKENPFYQGNQTRVGGLCRRIVWRQRSFSMLDLRCRRSLDKNVPMDEGVGHATRRTG